MAKRTKNLTMIEPIGGGLAVEPELAEAVRRVVQAATSENTRRAYAASFAKFEAWATRRGAKALPAKPAVVATYLVDLARQGAKVATVGLALAAISAAHRNAGLELDSRAREIREAMKGIRREYAAPQAQAAPSRTAPSTAVTQPWSHCYSPAPSGGPNSLGSTGTRPGMGTGTWP